MFETVSVIGGDLRQLTLAKLLKAEGYHVFLYGFDKDIQPEDIEAEQDIDYVLGSDIIILPVPVTFDGTTINSPYAKTPMTVEEFLYGINPSAIVFGGQIQPNLAKALENNHIAYRDYLKREELSIKNAIPIVLAIWLLILHKMRDQIYVLSFYLIGNSPFNKKEQTFDCSELYY